MGTAPRRRDDWHGGRPDDGEEAIAALRETVGHLHDARREVSRIVVGQDAVIADLVISLMCRGHALLEGVPGLGKTLLVRTIGKVFGLECSRIQFTPDLMPADITGTVVLAQDGNSRGNFEFQRGPIFAQMVLADEVNRATPKTQSSLLEAMQEQTVTAAGEVHELPDPFYVFATQNPIEMEGTYPLPEAQVDRFFFKVHIPYPSEQVLDSVVEQTTSVDQSPPRRLLVAADLERLHRWTRSVPIASHVRQAAVRIALATQPNDSPYAPSDVKQYVRYGVSPRGAQALVLAAKAHALLDGRYNVSFRDLRAVAYPALRHRIQVNFQGEAENVAPEALLDQVLHHVLGARG